MRVELLLFFCLACLALAAQAAPASAQNALLEQKLSQRRNDKKSHDSKNGNKHQHRQHDNPKHHRHHQSGPKKTRNEPVRIVEEAASRLAGGQGDTSIAAIEKNLRAKYDGLEEKLRDKKKEFQHHMQAEDAIHTAKYGQNPVKFDFETVSPFVLSCNDRTSSFAFLLTLVHLKLCFSQRTGTSDGGRHRRSSGDSN